MSFFAGHMIKDELFQPCLLIVGVLSDENAIEPHRFTVVLTDLSCPDQNQRCVAFPSGNDVWSQCFDRKVPFINCDKIS